MDNLGQSFWIWDRFIPVQGYYDCNIFSFPFSSEIFTEYLVSNKTNLPRIIKGIISQKWETIFWILT